MITHAPLAAAVSAWCTDTLAQYQNKFFPSSSSSLSFPLLRLPLFRQQIRFTIMLHWRRRRRSSRPITDRRNKDKKERKHIKVTLVLLVLLSSVRQYVRSSSSSSQLVHSWSLLTKVYIYTCVCVCVVCFVTLAAVHPPLLSVLSRAPSIPNKQSQLTNTQSQQQQQPPATA